MINISLPDLDKETLYSKVLQLVEDLCEDYSMESDFGILSMANQEIIDYLEAEYPDFSVDFNCHLDNDEIVFIYESMLPIFDKIEQFDKDNLLASFADKITHNSDNKQYSVNIHVKPKFFVNRSIAQNAYVKQNQF